MVFGKGELVFVINPDLLPFTLYPLPASILGQLPDTHLSVTSP
ncbi:hypothetical protein LYNGBM3L_01900 [Moorena producens 3L]|uniref:Uncharacterized protein n=1 Tax=Moorena producens 3L TaxID=489825 RepID=F4XI84_9CYAN|nr:hypothetical protein LYNGBM3L_01900 [Moorena producens 3L]